MAKLYVLKLKPAVYDKFEGLCEHIYSLVPKINRKFDGVEGPAIYAISRDPETRCVAFLVDDNFTVPAALKTKIQKLSENGVVYSEVDVDDNVMPSLKLLHQKWKEKQA